MLIVEEGEERNGVPSTTGVSPAPMQLVQPAPSPSPFNWFKPCERSMEE